MQFKLLSLFALAFLASSVVAAPLPQDGLAIASENMDDSQPARSLDVTSTAANDPIDETKITTEKVDQVVDSALTAGDDRIASFSNGA